MLFVIGGRAAAALEQLTAAVDALLALPRDHDACGELLRLVEVQRRRLEAVDQQLVADVLAAGHRDALPVLLCADAAEVRARVKRAGDLGPRQALTGEPLEPILSATATAVRRGEISAAQCDVVIECLERIPPTAPAAAWPVAEQVLLTAATVQPPRALRQTARELLARLDPDGLEPVEDRIARQRGFTLVKHRDGSATPRGRFTAELTAHWEAILDSLAAPQSTDQQPDPRTAAQRRHDGLLEAARRVLRSGELPDTGGVPVTVLATIPAADLARAAGHEVPTGEARTGADPVGLARLGHGQALSAKALLKLAGDAHLIPVILDDPGGVLVYGRARRLASPGQRLALAARDGGCCFPGCDRPPAWTEVHHVREWSAGGATDLDNLCLLCAHHHRSFEAAGWRVHMEHGVPTWTPPPFVDPDRTPMRNTVHRRPEIAFRQPVPA